jgi:pyruvate formate lyase activating enzyme
MLTGVIFDIKKFAIHDGPGIRTTVFFKGCPLTCRWCHNCPHHAIEASDNGMLWDDESCMQCNTCVQTCPAEAHEFIGQTVSIDDVVEKIKKDIVFYDASHGGVTFSGGEPLMQAEFLLNLLKACGQLDLHRTVDTTGYADAELISAVAGYTDLFLYDIKHMDPEKHQSYTGVSNEKILNNLKLLARQGANVNIRIPVIPGFNVNAENIDRTGVFLSSLPGIKKISLLPFHNAASGKYARLGVHCFSSEIQIPTQHEIKDIADRLGDFGLQVKIGG